MKDVTFTKLERFELKYHMNIDQLDVLTEFLHPWCGLDSHSERSPDGFYWVTSLYLDSPQLTFFRWKESKIENRFNMRIRTYGQFPDPNGPRFFEVKQKKGDVVTKTRGTLKSGNARALWDSSAEVCAQAAPKDRRNLEKFLRLAMSYQAEPHLLTQYRRKAWFGLYEDYARVTVDVGMRWREELGFDFSVDPAQM
ncbi:MAG TPA: polyphosphate polymerase domain-containing protein, partial [Fibrobacteraceae bacterium]|nr:polyphosphate polymerase domain-containing protein [Fibrobacteraceae bacterium]